MTSSAVVNAVKRIVRGEKTFPEGSDRTSRESTHNTHHLGNNKEVSFFANLGSFSTRFGKQAAATLQEDTSSVGGCSSACASTCGGEAIFPTSQIEDATIFPLSLNKEVVFCVPQTHRAVADTVVRASGPK